MIVEGLEWFAVFCLMLACLYVARRLYIVSQRLGREIARRTVRPADVPALPSDIVTTYSVVEE